MTDKAMNFHNVQKRYVGILFALLMICFATVFLSFAFRNITTIMSDCKTIYYCLDYNFINRQTDEDIETRTEHLKTCFHSFANNLLSDYTPYNFCKSYMLDVYGICAKFQDIYRLHNANYRIVRLLNDSLSICSDYDDMVAASNSIISFIEYLGKRGIPALYVIAPHKNYKYQSQLPAGVADFENENCNRMLLRIEGRVPVIDNREIFKNDPEKHYQLFYVGDSHWKVQYAYLSYCQIMQYLEEHFPITFEKKLKSIENFSEYSSGISDDLSKQYGRFYLPQEPTLYLKPIFFTRFNIFSTNNIVPNIEDVDYSGDFDMTLLCKFYPALSVFNPDAVNKKKLMVIGDSFSPPVMSFLSLSFQHVEYHVKNYYTGSLKRDIEKFQPDYVICIFTSRQTTFRIFDEFSE